MVSHYLFQPVDKVGTNTISSEMSLNDSKDSEKYEKYRKCKERNQRKD